MRETLVSIFYQDGGWYYQCPGATAKGPFDNPTLAVHAMDDDSLSAYEKKANDAHPVEQQLP